MRGDTAATIFLVLVILLRRCDNEPVVVAADDEEPVVAVADDEHVVAAASPTVALTAASPVGTSARQCVPKDFGRSLNIPLRGQTAGTCRARFHGSDPVQSTPQRWLTAGPLCLLLAVLAYSCWRALQARQSHLAP